MAAPLRLCCLLAAVALATGSSERVDEGAANSTEDIDCRRVEELLAYATRLQLHRWRGYACDTSPTLVRFKEDSAAELAAYVEFFATLPVYAGHVWDAPDGVFEPLEQMMVTHMEILPQCPQAVALAAVRIASRLIVQARMDRGEAGETPGATRSSAETFPSLVHRACCWMTLHHMLRDGIRRSGGDEQGGWPLAMGEEHVRAGFAFAGLDVRRCPIFLEPPRSGPAAGAPGELLLAGPRPSLAQLKGAVAERARALPPIVAMVGLGNWGKCSTANELRRRITPIFRKVISRAEQMRAERRKGAGAEDRIVVAARSIARAMAEARAAAAAAAEPAVPGDAVGGVSGTAAAYTARTKRAPEGGHTCEQLLSGMWYFASPSASRCKHLAAARLMGFAEGEVVLDWGAGCGHGLSWIAAETPILGIAVDLLPVNAAWALEHTPVVASLASGHYAQAFALLPDESVDHVIANGALLNLRPWHQCRLLREQALRVLRRGGTVWLGYLGIAWEAGTTKTTPGFWRHCLRNRPRGSIVYDVVDEIMTFGTMEHEHYASTRNGTGPQSSPSCTHGCVGAAVSLLLVKL